MQNALHSCVMRGVLSDDEFELEIGCHRRQLILPLSIMTRFGPKFRFWDSSDSVIRITAGTSDLILPACHNSWFLVCFFIYYDAFFAKIQVESDLTLYEVLFSKQLVPLRIHPPHSSGLQFLLYLVDLKLPAFSTATETNFKIIYSKQCSFLIGDVQNIKRPAFLFNAGRFN